MQTPPPPHHPSGRLPLAVKHRLHEKLYDKDNRRPIQEALDRDHITFLRELAAEYGMRTTSARHFLTTAGYDVPSRRPVKELPTQGLLKLESAERPQSLSKALAHALNAFSAETESGTPDFILAEYLLSCLDAFNQATRNRIAHNSKAQKP